jgi:hypothetical protein
VEEGHESGGGGEKRDGSGSDDGEKRGMGVVG